MHPEAQSLILFWKTDRMQKRIVKFFHSIRHKFAIKQLKFTCFYYVYVAPDLLLVSTLSCPKY